MKKYFLILFTLNVFGMPTLGDLTKYDYLATDSMGIKHHMKIDISLAEYDSSRNQYLEYWEQYLPMNPIPFTYQEWKDAKTYSSEQEIKDVLKTCEQKETLTVKAGTFETCHFHLEDGPFKRDVWIGMVPIFNMIKQIDIDDKGTVEVHELTGFQFGNP